MKLAVAATTVNDKNVVATATKNCLILDIALKGSINIDPELVAECSVLNIM